MKIIGIDVQVMKPESYNFTWSQKAPARQKYMTLVRVTTDDGIVGLGMTAMPGSPEEVASTVKDVVAPQILGRDPWFREAIWQDMMLWSNRGIAGKAASIVDIALWDICGKAVDLPIYKLLGAYRERIPAYASTVSYQEVSEYEKLVDDCKRTGFRALKIHPFGDPVRDIELCGLIREWSGPDMVLMWDPVNDYDYNSALKVGRALEKLNYFWYEAPIRDDDLAGCRELARALDIPIAVGESFTRGPWEYPKFLVEGSGDIFRCVGDSVGGITAMRKIGALCEAHNRMLEPHSYGNTLTQAAHLHYMLSVSNCDFFECPVPMGMYDIGMKDTITIDSSGYVNAPDKPGLGYDIDEDELDRFTVWRG